MAVTCDNNNLWYNQQAPQFVNQQCCIKLFGLSSKRFSVERYHLRNFSATMAVVWWDFKQRSKGHHKATAKSPPAEACSSITARLLDSRRGRAAGLRSMKWQSYTSHRRRCIVPTCMPYFPQSHSPHSLACLVGCSSFCTVPNHRLNPTERMSHSQAGNLFWRPLWERNFLHRTRSSCWRPPVTNCRHSTRQQNLLAILMQWWLGVRVASQLPWHEEPKAKKSKSWVSLKIFIHQAKGVCTLRC